MSREEQEYSEKRDFIRMFIDAPIRYCAAGTEDWKRGVGKDLSATGIAFIANEDYQRDALIEIKLKPATSVTPPLEATVKVIRSVPAVNGGFELSTIIEKIHR